MSQNTQDNRIYEVPSKEELASDYGFWNELKDYYPEVIRLISDMSRKSYVSVTNLQNNITWWSQPAVDFFGVEKNLTQVGNEKVKITVHPDDKEYYRKAYRDRVQGIDLDIPISYRINSREGHYDKITATCRMIKDAADTPRFLMIYYENHGIADEVDALTGLYSEATFISDIESFIRNDQRSVIVKLGIDQFSNMNVLYGAEYSDGILESVSLEIQRILDGSGTLYRLAGAKFAIVFDDISFVELHIIYDKIVEALNNNIRMNNMRVPLKISAGALRLDPNVTEINDVRSRMTYAHNQSRYNHHGKLVVFNNEVAANNTDNLNMVSIIHQDAVEDKEGFFLCYQPIVNPATGDVRGMEALIRWKKDPYGVIPPFVFIEWLEEDACIYDLGNWILKTALEDCKRVANGNPDFFVNVNVCPAQLERKEFRNQVTSILKESGLNPRQLCIEITERCRKLDIEFLHAEVEFFKAQGIKIALDDFGTGSSSLSLVLGLPIDEVKIDMSFIRGIEEKPFNQEMVRGVVGFANRMSLETCIEGVENENVRDHLMEYGATYFQGYYYDKPITIDEFAAKYVV